MPRYPEEVVVVLDKKVLAALAKAKGTARAIELTSMIVKKWKEGVDHFKITEVSDG